MVVTSLIGACDLDQCGVVAAAIRAGGIVGQGAAGDGGGAGSQGGCRGRCSWGRGGGWRPETIGISILNGSRARGPCRGSHR